MTILQEESAVLICQRALALAEYDYVLTSLQEASPVARQCLARYDIRRRAVLERLDWGFARARVLGQRVVDAVAPPDLPAAWARPPRGLRVRAVWDGSTWAAGVALRFKAEAHLYTEAAEAVQIVFTDDASNPALFPPVFTTALEYLLAADFAMLFARSVNRQDVMLGLFRDALQEGDMLEAFETPGGFAFGPDFWTDAIMGGF